MMRSNFDSQLVNLHEALTAMGLLCERAIALSTGALAAGDAEMAKQVSPLEREIDQMEREIEGLCLKLLLRQQPVAGDLRQISAALKMITDLERIGDQAEDIAEIIPYLNGRTPPEDIPLEELGKTVIRMVTGSVNAYVKEDAAQAQGVMRDDDTADTLFDRVKGGLIALIAADAADGSFALDLLMIAKYLERIGDHAVNVAEWVMFSITGEKKG